MPTRVTSKNINIFIKLLYVKLVHIIAPLNFVGNTFVRKITSNYINNGSSVT